MTGNASDRVKLLIVVNHAGFFLSHRLPIALAAKQHGYDVHVATPMSKHVPLIIDAGLQWHPVRLRRSSVNVVSEVLTVVDLTRLYRSLQPDIVHHVTQKVVLYGTFAAWVARVPAVVNAVSGLGHVFHGRGAIRFLRTLILGAWSIALRHPKAYWIFQNKEDRDLFVHRKLALERNIRLIRGSGVDTEKFRPRSRVSTSSMPMVILASRLLYTKGVADFVASARNLKGVARFAIVGEPDPDNPASIEEEQLREWASDGSVEYWGRREDMPDVLAQTDVFCLPTYYPEGVPKALIEAAACAIAIVTTDTAGCRDIVHDGENGILIPPQDVPSLTKALEILIADRALRQRMGVAGRELATREFSLQSVVAATLSLYEEMTA